MADETTKKPAARAERIGKYEILGHIATGGMAVIYKARDVDLDRLVALKILPPDMAKQKTTLVRFGREARAAATLRHENIVNIFDVGEVNGTHFIALEFIEGTDLQDYINRKCRLDPEEARQIMMQATRALLHAYEHGIVHRDIKPSNFLLLQKDKRLIVKLTDFGLAMRYENDAEFRITRDKTTVGTVDYMSPEQARNSRSADIRSDIYSLGCTAFHMLAGMAPFARGTLPERIVQHMQAPPPDMRKLNKSVPEYLVAIINRMLAKEPKDRYQTPAELLNDLENPGNVATSDRPAPDILADPEDILAPDPRGPAPPKPERGKSKPKSDPTSVIETERTDDAIEAPKPVMTPRVKKPAAAKPKSPERADEPPPRDLTNGFSEPNEPRGKKDRGKKKDTPPPPLWIVAIGGTVAVLVLIMIVMAVVGNRTPPQKDPDKKPGPAPIVIIPDKRDETPNIDTSPDKMTVAAPVLPIMDTSPDKADRAKLRKEYYGPFMVFPAAPGEATILHVGRATEPGPGAFRTLEEALAQTKQDVFSVIEIRDNGPLFIPVLPALTQRWIMIRGGAGFRPLIVWEMPKKALDGKAPLTFATLTRGKLIIENLDFVMNAPREAPATVFDLSGSDFYARNCTFSAAGKTGQGVALVRRVEGPKTESKTQTWLQRCYARGPDLTLLNQRGRSAEILIEESLIAGYQQPLLQLRGRDEDDIDLYCVRSTLVCGQNFLRWQTLAGKGGSPSVQAWLLDSIVSRDDTTAPQGDLIHLADGADAGKMHMRAANSAYAGWKQLLASESKVIPGNDLALWHRQWVYGSGDRALAETWPSHPPSGLEESSAGAFLPGHTPIAFASLTGPGAIGCIVGWLPPAPKAWHDRLFESRPFATIAAADFDPPRIEIAGDNLYHGERLDLNQIDLGAYLAERLQKTPPAPRVVLHLFGTGGCQTSPLHIKGVQNLVLYFEPTKLNDFFLEVNPAKLLKPTPAIEMSGGRLEMIGVRFRLAPFTLVSSIVSVQDGDLTATRCWLQGPLVKSPETFQSLILIGNGGTAPTTLLLRDNVLLSSNAIVEMRDQVQLRARKNLFFSLGDGIVIDANRHLLPMTHVLDHNTFAARRQAIVLRAGPDFTAAGQVLMQANSNAFWSPFKDADDERAVMRGTEPWIARGHFAWQGRFNVYDKRLPRYLAAVPKQSDTQTLRDWQQAWGAVGEQDAYAYDPGLASKQFEVEGVAPQLIIPQLERLALPRTVHGDPNQEPPGANLFFLGLAKKKG